MFIADIFSDYFPINLVDSFFFFFFIITVEGINDNFCSHFNQANSDLFGNKWLTVKLGNVILFLIGKLIRKKY